MTRTDARQFFATPERLGTAATERDAEVYNEILLSELQERFPGNDWDKEEVRAWISANWERMVQQTCEVVGLIIDLCGEAGDDVSTEAAKNEAVNGALSNHNPGRFIAAAAGDVGELAALRQDFGLPVLV